MVFHKQQEKEALGVQIQLYWSVDSDNTRQTLNEAAMPITSSKKPDLTEIKLSL